MAERIEVLLGVETLGDDGNPDFPHRFDMAFAKLLWLLFYADQLARIAYDSW